MLYLSQLLGTPVEDLRGERIGKIIDVTVPAAQIGQPEPTYLTALLVEGQQDQLWRVPSDAVEWHEHVLRLGVPLEQLAVQVGAGLAPALPLQNEVSLAHDVLDKQVIDVVRKKAVRVNDICLTDEGQILGIDNSTLGLVRRLAPNWLLGTKTRRSVINHVPTEGGPSRPPTPTNLIPWDRIELISSQQPVGAQFIAPQADQNQETTPRMPRPQSGHLAELRPADIAEIVHQLTPGQGARLIEGLDNETAADAMEEIDTERQRHILENIQADRAADILEAMGPDEAADLLAQLPEERAQELLGLMQPEESEDVQELLEYEDNSAGGLMTTDYIALNQTRSVAEALDAVRHFKQEQDVQAAYVYCVPNETEDECSLSGVVSLWDLLVAAPSQSLQDLMKTDLITVQTDTEALSVASVMAKYNLLAVPVVTKEGILEGIVTVDDALDVLLPADKRRKPTRMY